MWRKILALGVVTGMLLLASPHMAIAGDYDNNISVGLESASYNFQFRIDSGEYTFVDGATNMIIERPQAGELWAVEKNGPNLKIASNGDEQHIISGPLLISPVDAGLNLFTFKGIKYREKLIFKNLSSGVLAINQLPLEYYLYGVVGEEIGNNAHTEALKAQAVVSRSYALALKKAKGSYDVGVDTGTQVYKGYTAEISQAGQRVVEAVYETRGQAILYDGQVIQAFFHSNSGGYTENSENIWIEPLPYIKAVPSPYDIYAAQYQPQSNDWPGITYSWEKQISRQELQSLVSRWNTMADSNSSFNPIYVGSVKDVGLSRLQRDGRADTKSGRVTELTITGDNGIAKINRDRIRILLGLRSTLFDLKLDSTVSVLDGSGVQQQMNSLGDVYAVGYDGKVDAVNENGNEAYLMGQSAKKQVPKTFSNIYISGKGYGHGLGMSQWGARGMANDGYKYKEIIQHYYNQDNLNDRLTIEQVY